MTLAEIMPWEDWVEFEKEFNERSGLNSCVIDRQGVRITAYRRWANPLCPAVRGDAKGLAAICGRAKEILSDLVPRPDGLVVGACEAGMVIVGVPIFHQGVFLGIVGGCGMLSATGEVNAVTVGRATGLSQARISTLCRGVGRLMPNEIEALGHYVKRRFEDLRNVQSNQGGSR